MTCFVKFSPPVKFYILFIVHGNPTSLFYIIISFCQLLFLKILKIFFLASVFGSFNGYFAPYPFNYYMLQI